MVSQDNVSGRLSREFHALTEVAKTLASPSSYPRFWMRS